MGGKEEKKGKNEAAGNWTRIWSVTGINSNHYTTAPTDNGMMHNFWLFKCFQDWQKMFPGIMLEFLRRLLTGFYGFIEVSLPGKLLLLRSLYGYY